jgi:hypothetical protein
MACATEHAAFNFVAVIAATAAVQQRSDQPVDGTALGMVCITPAQARVDA